MYPLRKVNQSFYPKNNDGQNIKFAELNAFHPVASDATHPTLLLKLVTVPGQQNRKLQPLILPVNKSLLCPNECLKLGNPGVTPNLITLRHTIVGMV